MKRTFLAAAVLVALACTLGFAQDGSKKPDAPVKKKADLANFLQDISVTIVSDGGGGHGEGSGVVITRKMKSGDSVNFVWTAAHVVDNLRSQRTVVDPKSGSNKIVVEFLDAKVVKSLVEDGRNVGKVDMFAEVIRYNAEEDLALLRIRKKNFNTASAEFYLDDKVIPAIGTELVHVGSLLGQMGSNSMTRGIMSQHGRLVNKKVFDQTTVAAFPGSSGGGVYLEDGRLVGLVLRGAGETFNLIGPVRRMHQWAKDSNIEWAIDPKVAMPTEDELKKLPVEDIGVQFSYSTKSDAASGGPKVIRFGTGSTNHLGEDEDKFPTMYGWTPKAAPKVVIEK